MILIIPSAFTLPYNTAMKGGGKVKGNEGTGAIYGLGFLGALVYFIQTANSFVDGLIGIFLAIFWPGVIVYKVLELLKL